MQILFKTLAATDTPTQVTGASTKYTRAEVYGIKSFSASGYPVYNTNPIYLGASSGRLYQQVPTGVGATALLNNFTNRLPIDDLGAFWLMGQNGDGVYIVFN